MHHSRSPMNFTLQRSALKSSQSSYLREQKRIHVAHVIQLCMHAVSSFAAC